MTAISSRGTTSRGGGTAAGPLLSMATVLGALFCGSVEAVAQIDEPPIVAEDREHWSFRPLVRPAVPPVRDSSPVRNPVDLFIGAALDENGIAPVGEADSTTLIRRLYFDLLGLPPEPRETEAFQRDPARDAYERLVERVLASPHYGERWGQHWLDLARFAETDGFEHDKVRPDAWRYRDWVVGALNDDLAYDRFVRLQLAGDELEPDSESARTATAFCLSGPDMPDINSQEERRHYLLNEMTSTVGEVMMGLQIGCAQCHDHKYDPISQADFYRMRSLFEPAVRVKRNKSVGVLSEASGRVPPSYLMVRGDFRRPGPVLKPAFPRIANPADIVPVLGVERTTSGRRSALADWITRADHPLAARVIANRVWQYHFGEGLSLTPSDFGVIGDEPLHLDLLDWLATELVRHRWSLKHLHRLIVNSATYRRAGQAETAGGDLGGVEPSWRKASEIDPGNRYLARFPRQRLSGESIRDAMLAAAGALDTHQGGPGVRPPLPAELVQTLLVNQWKESPSRADHYRRSIYVFARRNLRYPIFEAFDRPDANASCPSRSVSTTAPQSLLLLNSEFSLELARRFAGRVMMAAGESVTGQIEYAVRVAFGRPPSRGEVVLFTTFIDSQVAALGAEGRTANEFALPVPCLPDADPCSAAALTDLCLALFNANEFLYID